MAPGFDISHKRKKEEIVARLKKTYCRIQRSSIHGVGIVAIRDIPANTNPFEGIRNQKWYSFTPMELASIQDQEIMQMIYDFYATDEDGALSIPEYGLTGMDISFFLNTSDSPNIKSLEDGAEFVSLHPIRKGEELTVAYSSFDYRYKEAK